MTQRVELRKHGPFDLRYGVTRLQPAPPSLRRPEAAELAWHDFHAHFFPDCRRHDSDALAAYQVYRSGSPPRAGLARQDGREETRGTLPPFSVLVWEWEGGAGLDGSRAPAVRQPAPRR